MILPVVFGFRNTTESQKEIEIVDRWRKLLEEEARHAYLYMRLGSMDEQETDERICKSFNRIAAEAQRAIADFRKIWRNNC